MPFARSEQLPGFANSTVGLMEMVAFEAAGCNLTDRTFGRAPTIAGEQFSKAMLGRLIQFPSWMFESDLKGWWVGPPLTLRRASRQDVVVDGD